MKRVYVFCEGQTEETFVNTLLAPFLLKSNVVAIPIVFRTSTKRGKHTGGVVTYAKIKNELFNFCGEHPDEKVTTMFDYYAIPKDTPGLDCKEKDIFKRIGFIERAIFEDINRPNLSVNIMLHEFEALLFSQPKAFINITSESIVDEIQKIRNQYDSPEFINSSKHTAPSKRLLSLIDDYRKVSDGIVVAKAIGIEKMMTECTHFNQWINSLL